MRLTWLRRWRLLGPIHATNTGTTVDDAREMGLELRVGETSKLAQTSEGQRIAGEKVLQGEGGSHVKRAGSTKAGLGSWLLRRLGGLRAELLQAWEGAEKLEGVANACTGRVGGLRRPDGSTEVRSAREEALLVVVVVLLCMLLRGMGGRSMGLRSGRIGTCRVGVDVASLASQCMAASRACGGVSGEAFTLLLLVATVLVFAATVVFCLLLLLLLVTEQGMAGGTVEAEVGVGPEGELIGKVGSLTAGGIVVSRAAGDVVRCDESVDVGEHAVGARVGAAFVLIVGRRRGELVEAEEEGVGALLEWHGYCGQTLAACLSSLDGG